MSIYTKQARTEKGAILFAVCRGKISEGIDFTDELARAVFMIGIPYPPIYETKVVYKKEYLNRICNTKNFNNNNKQNI